MKNRESKRKQVWDKCSYLCAMKIKIEAMWNGTRLLFQHLRGRAWQISTGSRPDWFSDFENSQNFIVRICLEKKKQQQ